MKFVLILLKKYNSYIFNTFYSREHYILFSLSNIDNSTMEIQN